jgi:hypothetical protein
VERQNADESWERSILDELTQSVKQWRGPFHPRSGLLWFQSRLIASAIGTEPGAIYFSDL